jgi:hypothetical protein
VCGLRVTVPWWRSLGGRSGLQQATTSAWHNVGDNGADVDGLFRTPLPSGGGGDALCRVCLFVFEGLFVWWCPLRRVLYQYFFFLNDTAVLLLLFKKMMYILDKSFIISQK